ncbi:uncharacterized protein MONOS_13941 [Monocercomonoides exilis]|uniref:uncharacterized protein n=1 Tax=Monocercomonoides exilis TaxID=2049356 RepID=UPI00355A9C65|nr:hypothetical protein MONOS_13941 [Monocercomonoides exilis]|eukprot:MONOS_13941.1-p1 / transcript=MONOS_13941.1 / gene=MONOS_13941 / organism=Monocercomonoides_exilis_PA203 / gene_product=unspecified product / transcript_product=unspecified product / location=Mono_scaffold00908:5401-6852(-) / protein_length=445 / sequence_SO=supercontig / SO=protein_coding / is_pseudo=false
MESLSEYVVLINMQETDNTKMFNELFSELEHCNKDEQKQKIGEINEHMEEMNEDEYEFVFTKELFNKMDEMIKEEKLWMDNAILLLKHVGYWKEMKRILSSSFYHSILNSFVQKMIIDENEKKIEKNVKLLVDLCESYLLSNSWASQKLLSTCVPCLLKVALNKEEREEIQKEVEMALLALSNIPGYYEVIREVYLNEIKEAIQYHQEHFNLTQLAYQSAWQFLINRFDCNGRLEKVIVNELHFAREARREIEELSKCIDWKKKEKIEKKRVEAKEKYVLMRLLEMLKSFFFFCKSQNEEHVGLISSIVQMYRASRDNYEEISSQCTQILKTTVENKAIKVDFLLKGGVIDVVLEEVQQPTIDVKMDIDIIMQNLKLSSRLKEKTVGKMEEVKRKELKRKVFESLEEEGYEDIIICFYETYKSHDNKFIYKFLPENLSDYFVYI